MSGPKGRRQYKLPRKVVQIAEHKYKVPDCGGWLVRNPVSAEQYANAARKDQIGGSWREPGTELLGMENYYLVLNCGLEPNKNKWGEICP